MKIKNTVLCVLAALALTATATPKAHACFEASCDRMVEAIAKAQYESRQKQEAEKRSVASEKVEADKGGSKGFWETVADTFRSIFGISKTSDTK